MKILQALLIFMCFQTIITGQEATKQECEDSTKYRIKTDWVYAELEIKINGNWRSVLIRDEPMGRFEYKFEGVDLNGTGTEELVIYWSDAKFGSGGGITIKGVQIWDLDNGTKLFDEITYCSDEGFGRNENPAYLVECHKIIQIIDQTIKVNSKDCYTHWSETDDFLNPTSNCSLTTLEEGIYFFDNGKLIKE